MRFSYTHCGIQDSKDLYYHVFCIYRSGWGPFTITSTVKYYSKEIETLGTLIGHIVDFHRCLFSPAFLVKKIVALITLIHTTIWWRMWGLFLWGLFSGYGVCCGFESSWCHYLLLHSVNNHTVYSGLCDYLFGFGFENLCKAGSSFNINKYK